ncbi:pepsin/retropepsin-like aspartic protease family protein [Aequorivita sp. SDUM287046]|uniref:Pepsin/retropepsin-like aspartic protease family protein n=1 Tax=Aequorivita aurantiaca TaxID=3053356 RepID=A0ABT8DH70_9FLAO|nr:pepsin/retropepsin-like aspartic protease family protein [Aequorivita aurantiaca]MDN3724212.1 pepsin/retropepsin-like aspartic protease family protein [Aequorivita aurantiaca]
MKHRTLYFWMIFLIAACGNLQHPRTTSGHFTRLNYLFTTHQYFKLTDEFEESKPKLSEAERLIISAKLNSVFNKKETSNAAIEELFETHKNQLADSTKIQLLEIEMNNSVLLYDYKKALEISEKILAFSNVLDEEERTDIENNRKIFNILENVPKQTISINETSLQITKDIAGLSRIPVKLGLSTQSAVFDTGANFSVITDSLALKSGLKTLLGTFKVTAITGNKVDSKIAVAETLKLGSTTLKNVIFLVFPEASLSFPEANYAIEIIIGFPVIEALTEISIVKDSIFYIPKMQSENPTKNMALNFLTPVVEVMKNGKSLPFTFDTGASDTMLYYTYFKENNTEILNSTTLDSSKIGGAGGTKIFRNYKIPFSGNISGKNFTLQNTSVLFEEHLNDKTGVYGNLGKDVVKQFDTLTLNFEKMFLKLN